MKATFDTANRKDLVAAIAEVTGMEKKYLGAPSMNYRVGCFTIDRDCNLTCEDSCGTFLEETITDLEEKGFHGAIEEVSEIATNGKQSETYGLTVALPIEKVAVGNLTSLLEAKGDLIKKALGISDIRIELDEETVSFPWFETMPEPDEIKTYTDFIGKLAEFSLKRKRINSYQKEIENEKYAFRCFLLSLGFIGDEYKKDRKILLKNLEGSSAFKNGARKEPASDEVSE